MYATLHVMDETYRQIREMARELVNNLPEPLFYKKEAEALLRSHRLFNENRQLKGLITYLEAELNEDFGHGLAHSRKVAIEAGALIFIERRGAPAPDLEALVFQAHCAGLLHDTMRKHRDHAEKGAAYAEETLGFLGFSQKAIEEIAFAILCHEAFSAAQRPVAPGQDAQLLADTLYDADKFRWGPDNFTHTVWDMVSYTRIPLPLFISHYPKALEGISRIRATFRSESGKLYGPGFIDIGLEVGKKLYKIIRTDFSPRLDGGSSILTD